MLKELIYDKQFRKRFPEFDLQYHRIDDLGGKSCKSCNKRKVRVQVKTVENMINRSPELRARFEKDYSKLEDPKPLQEKDYSTLINYELFERSLPSKEIKQLLSKEYPNYTFLENAIMNWGYYSEEFDKEAMDAFQEYSRNKELRKKFNKLLDTIGRNKLFHDNPKCKILEGHSLVDLENQVNEFLIGKRINSISVEGLRATVLYRLMK